MSSTAARRRCASVLLQRIGPASRCTRQQDAKADGGCRATKRALRTLPKLAVGFVLLTGCARPPTVTAIQSGQTIALQEAYWINVRSCQSLLIRVDRVEIVSGSQYLRLSLKPGMVRTTQCGNQVPGAVVLATAEQVPAETKVQLAYIVYYDTDDGTTTSYQSRNVVIFP